MNRVTIANIVGDYDANRYPYDGGRIEVVPRKMVEMIIAQCEEDVKDVGRWQNAFDQGRTHEANKIKKYAESLLKQFEEDEKWINIPKGLSEELQELELEERL